jgi:hypothetical protein
MKSHSVSIALTSLSLFMFSGTAIGEPVNPEPKDSPEIVAEAPAEKVEVIAQAVEATTGESVKLELKGSPEFVSEAPLEKIVGLSQGVLMLAGDFSDLNTLQATVVIPVESMRTGNAIRDDHLRGEGWLNGKANPNVEFTSTSVEILKQKGDGTKGKAKLNAIGNISINGVSKPLTAEVMIKWSSSSVKLKTKFSVALADFNVKGAEGVVGNKVGKSIDIKAKFSVKR